MNANLIRFVIAAQALVGLVFVAIGGEYRRLEGAIGTKADRLFYERLLGEKARGDIFEETVNAFRTHYDDSRDGAKGKRRGGWQGEYWGKTMLSHCAYVRYSGDVQKRDFVHRKALELIREFQRPDGYLGTYADADFILGSGWNLWGRKYTMWALVETYDLTKDERILKAATAMAVHAYGQLKKLKVSVAETGCFVGLPSMSLLKPLILIYNRTGNRDVRDFIEHIVSENDRADGRAPNLIANAFSEKPICEWYPNPEKWAKSYEMMSVVEGLIQYAETFKAKRPLEAAKRIFDKLLNDEMNGVCSVGYHDHFTGARSQPNAISESCDVIHWMRLCKYLYLATGETRYIDLWERAFLNAFLAGVFRDGTWGTHDVRGHGKRHLVGVFEVKMYYHFCCIANDPRGFCDYADLAFEQSANDRYWLNFFTDGEYSADDVKVKVTGNYPVDDRIRIRVTTPKAITLSMRDPQGFSFTVTGVKTSSGRGRINADIHAGETSLELKFDFPLEIKSWRSDRKNATGSTPANYYRETFEVPYLNREMEGFARNAPGVRVMRGPLLLAKGSIVGDGDREALGDLGIDESWKATLTPLVGKNVWGAWTITFEKNGVSKSVGACDYQSVADFDGWQNTFSIWF